MKTIVTTTINSPTKAIKKFASLEEYHLIVVGDLKTPHDDFKKLNCTYLHPSEQEARFPVLSDMLGWNTIERRNIGFLHALEAGSEICATVDDDNVPIGSWGSDLLVGTSQTMTSYQAPLVFDPFAVTNHSELWHRGYPIQLLRERGSLTVDSEFVKVDVEAQFWNGDPDIDAVCRMEHAPECEFDPNSFPFTSKSLAPFNSQNTFLTRDALKNYFMFPFVGRMDDIWGAYFLEAQGFRVAYSKASVVQERNVHNLTRDFELEIPGYLKSFELCRALVEAPESAPKILPQESWMAYQEYLRLARSYD